MKKNKINRFATATMILLMGTGASAQQQVQNKKAVPGNAQEIAIPAPPLKQIDLPAQQSNQVVPGTNNKPVDTDKLVRPDHKKPGAENMPPALIPVAPPDAPAPVSKEMNPGSAGQQRTKPVAADPVKEQ